MKAIAPEIRQMAIDLYLSGKSQREVAAAIGKKQGTVQRWINAAGISRTQQDTQCVPVDVKGKAIEMYKTGLSCRKIGAELGVTAQAVWRWCKNSVGVTRTISEARFKGGLLKSGYREITVGGEQILQHRAVAEAILARKLTSNEHVHHVNECRSDNRPANLWVFPTAGAHTTFHKTGTIHPDTIKLIPYCGEVA